MGGLVDKFPGFIVAMRQQHLRQPVGRNIKVLLFFAGIDDLPFIKIALVQKRIVDHFDGREVFPVVAADLEQTLAVLGFESVLLGQETVHIIFLHPTLIIHKLAGFIIPAP